jgi:hypothetical protein
MIDDESDALQMGGSYTRLEPVSQVTELPAKQAQSTRCDPCTRLSSCPPRCPTNQGKARYYCSGLAIRSLAYYLLIVYRRTRTHSPHTGRIILPGMTARSLTAAQFLMMKLKLSFYLGP